ncbi:methyl-accepting chemotaxis protein [Piscinibacter sakaiensis]|uniref:methyl-accepting chemotaxis protein n=1 Tax=Piscinibacter sakaiensis TaxID=1547922 RepID=UPI003AABA515
MSFSDPTAAPASPAGGPAPLRGTRLDVTAGGREALTGLGEPDSGAAAVGLAAAYRQPPDRQDDAQVDHHAPGGRERQLPLIGGWPQPMQRRLLTALLVLGLLGLLAMAVIEWQQRRVIVPAEAIGSAMLQTQRVAKVAAQPLNGNAAALGELQAASTSLDAALDSLIRAADGLGDEAAAGLRALLPISQSMQKNAGIVLAERSRLVEAAALQKSIEREADLLEEGVESLAALKMQQGASAAEVAAVGQLMMMSQRIPLTVRRLMTPAGVDREMLVSLGKDLSVARSLLDALSDGHPGLRLSPPRDRLQRERLAALGERFEALQAPAASLLNMLQQLSAARIAQTALAVDADRLARGLDSMSQRMPADGDVSGWQFVLGVLSVGLLLLGGIGLLRLFVIGQKQRAAMADAQRVVAQRLQAEARRSNDANQTAILRLMNELQAVAEGDLTRQATVSEAITGAIADSLNYTIEELRALVAQVQGAAGRVTDTTEQVETTSVELLATSAEQLREIRDTGEAVLQMAGRIVQVSSQAQLMAHVAHQSLAAADSGSKAVQATIGGMNVIREQIQDTSKRIKRLGESSQEIGEITELISDITEQTNVLALNAAIQAASAGEAGRGFSVVAEEVQRLAERSADATRQIAALVRVIQTDTQDAVAAMERSTQGVVEGTRLSDAAGAALADIDGVSRRLSELIAGISHQALQEADTAHVVATNIQHILAVTEQTGEGTRSTARIVRELAQTADELRQSVARFKIV